MKDYKKLFTAEKKVFWKENPIHGDIDISIEGIAPFKMHCKNDDTVVKELYWTAFKGWEFTSLTLWNNLLDTIEKGIALDVGTYSGIYSLIAAQKSPVEHVYAFDIQDKCIDRTEANFTLNNIPNASVIKAACSNENGEAVFHYYEEEGIISSVAGIVSKEMNNLSTTVKSIRLDDWYQDLDSKTPISLLKMDVEGAEQLTLKGMTSILKESSPNVLIEINDHTDLKAVKKLFPKGYHVFDINEEELVIKKLNFFNKPTKFRNYLFTKLNTDSLSKIFSGTIVK
ncbi:MAG: FkbM family methyltransferase [Dokdonia sp.]|jgi:FkbM family methyltransferase